jgi:hypothetical protein
VSVSAILTLEIGPDVVMPFPGDLPVDLRRPWWSDARDTMIVAGQRLPILAGSVLSREPRSTSYSACQQATVVPVPHRHSAIFLRAAVTPESE